MSNFFDNLTLPEIDVLPGYYLTKLNLDNINEITRLLKEVSASEWAPHPAHCEKATDPTRWQRILSEGFVYGIRDKFDRLEAVASIRMSETKQVDFGTLFVGPRRLGLGTTLAQTAILLAKALNAVSVVAVVANWNMASLATLAKLGFQVTKTEPSGWDPSDSVSYLTFTL